MKKKILVIDNHPVMLRFMTNLLSVKEHHEVVTAEDGLSAIDILKGYTPEVIFVDLVMPNINGEKLCRIIRKTPKLSGVKIFVLSAIAAETNMNCAELGVDAFIAKGPLNKMAKHVLAAMNQSCNETPDEIANQVIGLEDIFSREITKELLSDNTHLQIILDSMSEGILELTHDARIVYANPPAVSLIGEHQKNILALHLPDFFSGNDRQKIQSMLDTAHNTSQVVTTDSPLNMNKKLVEFKILPLEKEKDKTLIMLSDVTEQKRREAQLQQAQKMEAVGTLAAGIAHDFNNLLMGIQGYASLMLLNIDAGCSYYEMLKSIEKQVKSGSRLTRQLLGYARKGKYEVRLINLNQLVNDTAETFGRTKKNIIIHKDLAKGLYPIEADEEQIEQVMLNLFINAADAMPGGGEIFLQTRNTTDKEIKSGLYNKAKAGNYVMLTFADTGTGMDEKTMERIYDPFFTTKEMGRGTGLGLASTYGIIKGHGGYIDVASEMGINTTFKIYLPVKEKHSKEKSTKVLKHNGIHKIRGTILLVDDEEVVRDVTLNMLKIMGLNVITAMDGKEAVEIYQKKQTDIDLIMLDMVMPSMGGSEAFDRLKKINPDIKVILLSGYSINSEAAEILKRGCNGFLQKPFTVKELSQKILDILDKNGYSQGNRN